MDKNVFCCIILLLSSIGLYAQEIPLTSDRLEAINVSMSFEKLDGYDVIKVVKDPKLDNRQGQRFVKVINSDFDKGTIEVKVLSRIEQNAPEQARGFIGVLFRMSDDYTKYENIYLRPLNARVEDQLRRNHTIQYASSPGYSFVEFREMFPGKYESYTDMGLNEWITMTIEVDGETAKLFVNGNEQPSLIVNDLKLGGNARGYVGLSVGVDFGTEGYFRDLKITKK